MTIYQAIRKLRQEGETELANYFEYYYYKTYNSYSGWDGHLRKINPKLWERLIGNKVQHGKV